MTISYQTPIPISLSSQNGSITLAKKNPRTFYSFRLLFFNATINLTVNYYDINGSLVSSVTYNKPESISVKNGSYSLITWNDTNVYNVQGWYQEIIPENQTDSQTLISEFDLNAVPIGEVNINSPLDSGYVAVKSESGSVVQTVSGSQTSVNPYALTNKSLSGNTNATAGTSSQIITTSTLARHFQFVNTGSASISIGDSVNQPIQILAGGSFFFDGTNETIDLSQWYTISGTASVTYKVVYQQ